MTSSNHRHILRLLLSCRKISAQVKNTTTDSIIAMASSSEQEFTTHYRTTLNRNPRSQNFWDAKIATRVGENLGFRLNEIGVTYVAIDVAEEMARPLHFRKLVFPFFESVQRAGISVDGAEKLMF